MGSGRALKTNTWYSSGVALIVVLITGGGSSLVDAILEAFEFVIGDYRIRLVDNLESAGEARRFQGHTLNIELDTEADISDADLVIDLDQSYLGDAFVMRPELSMVSLAQRLFENLPEGVIRSLHGVIREPVVEVKGGVEALAGQVTQLFSGRDPEPMPFGGALAFNSRLLDDSVLIDVLREMPALGLTYISLERVQSDCFYTVSASLWLQIDSAYSGRFEDMATEPYQIGLGLAPDTGRVELDAPIRVMVRTLDEGWVHMAIAADLERHLWVADAKLALTRRLESLA